MYMMYIMNNDIVEFIKIITMNNGRICFLMKNRPDHRNKIS